MKSRKIASSPFTRRVVSLLSLASAFLCGGATALASDFEGGATEWHFLSGMDKKSFTESFKKLASEGFRIADIETYRVGRSTTVTTVWSKMREKDGWRIEMSLPITEFLEANRKHDGDGYALVEFETDRTGGATLQFSGVWLKRDEPLETEFYFGLESLDFSNRYGEMADRGFRLIDFEAYESNGKYRHSGLWLKNEGIEVRFYRAIEKNRFGEVASSLAKSGFRLLDIEGYNFEGKFVFAGEWVRLPEGDASEYAFDLVADEFYNKNSAYTNDGYRLTEFEAYEDNGNIYYAGSWLKSAGKKSSLSTEERESKKSKKPSSLEGFRSGEN